MFVLVTVSLHARRQNVIGTAIALTVKTLSRERECVPAPKVTEVLFRKWLNLDLAPRMKLPTSGKHQSVSVLC